VAEAASAGFSAQETEPVESESEKLLKAQIATMQAQLKQMADEAVRAKAAVFADNLIAEGKATPAEHAAIVLAYFRAAQDDDRHPEEVTFSDGTENKQGTRLDATIALFNARPKSEMLAELVDTAGSVAALANQVNSAAFKDGKKKPIKMAGETEPDGDEGEGFPFDLPEDRKAKLMAMTPLGRAMTKDKKKTAKGDDENDL
jgi:hypothetical protein